MNSAQAFMQGLYPPVGPTLGQETLRNNAIVEAPLNGYQLIPIQTVTSGTGSEDSEWLREAGHCANAIISSDAYYSSPEYMIMLNSTMDFYKNLAAAVDGTFSPDELSFENAFLSAYT